MIEKQRRLLEEFAGTRAHPALPHSFSFTLIFLFALVLGSTIAVVATLPLMWVAVVCTGLCGLLGIVAWWSSNWPIVPILRVILIASFSFKMEINLFPVFKYHESPPGVISSLMLIVSLMLLVAHFHDRLQGKPRETVFPMSFSLVSVALLLWCIVSTLDSSEIRFGFNAVWGLFVTLLICFVLANEFGSRAALRTAVITIATAVGINSLVGILQSTAGMFSDWTLIGAVKEEFRASIGSDEYLRASGFLGMSNSFAWYLITFLPVLLAATLVRVDGLHGWKRAFLATSSCLAVIALVMTYSRGGWAAFGLSLIVLVALAVRAAPPAERRRLAVRISVVVMLTALICLPLAKPIYLRLTEDDHGALAVRVPLMEVAQEMIADNPLLGVGPANYEAEMRRYDETKEKITDGFDWPVHNIFLHMTAEAGIPATLCFLTLIIIALGRGWRALSSHDPLWRVLGAGLIAGTLAYLWVGLKEPGSFGAVQLRLPFFTCGMLLALDRARRREEEGALKGG
jgi:putative inorganic carbon (HCO3(-)) transporter